MIVVEGLMDVIALDQAGIADAVAPLGTALTEAQLALLWRLSPAPCSASTATPPGRRRRCARRCGRCPMSARALLAFVTLPPGQDPDDLIRARGREALEALLETPEPLSTALAHELEAEPLRTPEQRAGLRRRLIDHVAHDHRPRTCATSIAPSCWSVRRSSQRRSSGPGPPAARPSAAAASCRRPGRPRPRRRRSGGPGSTPSSAAPCCTGWPAFPTLIGRHAEAIAALRLSEPAAARLRDLMLEAAMTSRA